MKAVGGGRLLAVGNAVGAGVGVWECLWGRVRAVGGEGAPPPRPPLKRFPGARPRLSCESCLYPKGGGGQGGAPCAAPAPCENVGHLGPVPPDGRGDRGTYRVPRRRTVQFLTQSKTSDHRVNQPCFTLKMPDCCLNLLSLPCGRMLPPVVGAFQGPHENANLRGFRGQRGGLVRGNVTGRRPLRRPIPIPEGPGAGGGRG